MKALLLIALWITQASGGSEAGFKPLFNGRDLTGWEGDRALWLVENGHIVGRSPGIKRNEFLGTTRAYGDFELRLSFRLRDGAGNSGVQFRSKRIPDHVSGFQADIGQKYWGCLYDEARRNKVLVQAPPELDRVLRKEGWNDYVIRAEGDQTVDYREADPSIDRTGIIALQIHSGGPMEAEFKDLRIKELRAKGR
ncbi:MAG: DUF1080 domain-containing protein [Acidobacteria bacterium]|nr:MAG: DUF1080 domain-containing protein [Acidobacteriota bacterium]